LDQRVSLTFIKHNYLFLGTGKTESVKALGHQLGRFVLVFNCDETFDFQAVGRILVGLCQVGAWGCFDEFNRLEERMLSAVSQQIQTIQEAVRAGGQMTVNLVGKNLSVNSNMAIFITMNPGYAGRSSLPDNLKQVITGL
jgi:dynein heavy chain 1